MKTAYHHGHLREELLRLGEASIAAQGLQRLGLRELARQAGVSSAAVFRHFANKDALVLAIAAEGFVGLIERLSRCDPLPPRPRLLAGFEAYLQFAADRPGCLLAMFSGVLERTDRGEAQEGSERAFAWLEANVLDGGGAKALVCFSALHGAAILQREMGPFPTVGRMSTPELALLLYTTLFPHGTVEENTLYFHR